MSEKFLCFSKCRLKHNKKKKKNINISISHYIYITIFKANLKIPNIPYINSYRRKFSHNLILKIHKSFHAFNCQFLFERIFHTITTIVIARIIFHPFHYFRD